MGLKAMLNTSTEFAASHNLLFNEFKTKYMYFKGPRLQAHDVIEFMGTAIDFVDRAELLGVSIWCDVKDRNINGSIQKFYCKLNSVLYDFKDIPCDVKTRLLDTYCLDLYGSQLWNNSKHDVNHFYVAWCKTIRRFWKIPNTTHCNLLSSINSSESIVYKLEKRCAKFIWSCLNCHNCVIKNIALSAKSSSSSDFRDNYRYLSYKYNLGIHV